MSQPLSAGTKRNDIPDPMIRKDQEDSFWDFREKPNKAP